MNNDFSAKTCPNAELIDISTLSDALLRKRIYICGNPLCTQVHRCNTTTEKKEEGIQYPFNAT